MELTKENIKSVLLELISEVSPKTQSAIVTLSKFYRDYLKYAEYNLSYKSILSIKNSFNHLASYRGDINLSEIDSLFVDLFMIELMKRAPKGYPVYFRTLRSAFNKAIEWNFLSINYFAKYKLPKRQKNEIKFFDEKELLQLVSTEKNDTLRNLYLLDFYTGLRLAEIQSLTWENVHLKEKYLLIGSEIFKTKSRKIRRVPLCEKAVRILQDQLPKIYKAEGKNFVFCKSNGFLYSSDLISKNFKNLLRLSGYGEEYHFHIIRHSTASNLGRLGVPVPFIQQILGHSDIKTTMLYTHTNITDLVTAIQKFDLIDNSQNKRKEKYHG